MAITALALAPAVLIVAAAARAEPLAAFEIDGDRIVAALGGETGDATRGRAALLDRASGNCLICHRLAASGERFQGEIGPLLDGVGSRLDAGQIRLRLVDQSRINPATLMPPYYRVDGLRRVAPVQRGKPALSAREIEDLIAYLVTLR
jgi:L-cysteine S-thiosulfotransferase